MYGIFDLAEQIRWMENPVSLAQVEEKQSSPFMELRGVNQFLHVQAFEDRNSWYYDDAFWQDLLDRMARSRHNFLDLHATYDLVTTLFPNVYPYLFYFDEYSDVGVPEEDAERNLEQLKKVVAMARQRGIKVGLMSYKGWWSIPKFTRRREPDNAILADYTAKCVHKLVTEIPGLEFVGFRIGESEKTASFYEDSYIRGLKDAGRTDMKLYTRSWVTTQGAVESIADSYPSKMYLEIKYNGEQLGLPYQVTGGWMQGQGSYAYQSYSNYPRKMDIIWQIRANGTHRIFPWGDPEFISRSIKACTLIDGKGYTTEPMTAYYPMIDYFTNTIYCTNDFYNYLTERDWFWYELWGRLGYDPDTPEDIWVEMFKDRFGEKAGAEVYKMFLHSSRLVPLIFSYRGAGPDHRSIAPELEWAGPLDHWTRARPLEVMAFLNPADYVEQVISGSFSGLIPPSEVCETLRYNSSEMLKAKEAARQAGVADTALNEFDYLSRNCAALKSLSDYYAEKIETAVTLEFARKTGAPQYYEKLGKKTRRYIGHWDDLVDVTEKAFHPFIETLRQRQLTFHWKDERKFLEQDIEFVKKTAQEALAESGKHSTVHALPPRPEETGNEISIACAVTGENAGTFSGTVSYRAYPHADEFTEVTLSKPDTSGRAEAVIDTSSLPGRSGILEYRIDYSLDGEKGRLGGDNPEGLFRAPYGEDRTPPEVTSPRAEVTRTTPETGTARIQARIEDPSGVFWARLHYKAMPSTAAWQTVEMESEGGNVWSAEVPITWKGFQYCFETVDKAGQGIVYPDIRHQTPYITVDGWNRDEVQQ
jgi:hypothetical protein